MKTIPVSALEAARKLESVRLASEQEKSRGDYREDKWHRSGEPLAIAAIKAISFLAPFEFEIVDVQEPKPGSAPDWVVVRDVVSGMPLRFDLLDSVVIRHELTTHYPNAESGYTLSVVVPRTGWHMKSAFRKHVGHQWKAVKPVAVESFQDFEAASAEYNRIVDSRLRDANG